MSAPIGLFQQVRADKVLPGDHVFKPTVLGQTLYCGRVVRVEPCRVDGDSLWLVTDGPYDRIVPADEFVLIGRSS